MSAKLLDRLLSALRGEAADDATRPLFSGQPITYDQAKELARHRDPEVRRTLAERSDVQPEILFFLAGDPAAEVRRAIAVNRSTPAHADLQLAADADPAVRTSLAHKIACLAPGLSTDEQDRLRRMTYEALELLARDQITRVRQILAETLKDVANAPPLLVRQLAHDSELKVSGPLLEHSPVLTDEDLLEIIQSAPSTGTLSCISRRSLVAAEVADAIARTDDVDAVAVLLGNPSAQIREETLDMLLDKAPAHEAWHAPLVHRPQLSARAATRLARFVADALLAALRERPDLDEHTKTAVSDEVRRRVEASSGGSIQLAKEAEPAEAETEAMLLERAEQRYREHKLGEPEIVAALERGEADYVLCALSVRSGLTVDLVRRIVASQSAKGILALTWQAGLGMAAALRFQTRLAKIAPANILRPMPGNQAFPLTASEMAWQIDFFSAVSGEAKVSD